MKKRNNCTGCLSFSIYSQTNQQSDKLMPQARNILQKKKPQKIERETGTYMRSKRMYKNDEMIQQNRC